jgi:isoquinoline 1-oxidoreductase alpha subunit
MAAWDLTINGEAHTVDAEADMPLLWVLRDLLNLTGTKYGCGIGACGACAILVAGQIARSCMLPISTVATQAITTIEGISPDAHHPVQQAWLAEAVSQCGYCQTGQIMTAVALLKKTPKPTDAEIDTAFANSLCRCGTYIRIRRALHHAAGG